MTGQRFLNVVLVLLLVLLTLLVAEPYVRRLLLAEYEPRAVTARGDLSAYEATATEIFREVSPSVVYIFTETAAAPRLGLPAPTALGAGSGFVWDAAGHVVTNHHVVQGADRVGVRFITGETVAAEVVGTAPNYDLAVLRLSRVATDLRPIALGTSEDLRVGQTAFAIGNPFGLSHTLTAGIISALDRRLPTAAQREIADVIQTDAAINPGNSGGPLLDSAGRLIGVNTAILSETGAYAGIGFAVPVDTVNEVVPFLIERGHVPTPGIGILAADPYVAARLGVEGVIVVETVPGMPAAEAGLAGMDPATGRLGDVITHVEGERVRTVGELAERLEEVGIGGTAEVTVFRNGRERTLRIDVVDVS